ncbi:EAL domain-containing protein [Marinomonas atlantica]|uniref:EAL domain-containing protein n=1 Tax=Marinomonas atlantica TaxID=1806668 RepID=UPI000830BD03|nr:EAL domain-containing protein [Marinomonas atlantica]MCO4784880.1 EAL domain-containing protein [Marinomonas atlantica]
MIKTVLFLLLSLMSGLVFSVNENVRLQLKREHSFAFAGYYAAQQLGYYRDAGLDVDVIPGNAITNVYSEVATGKADYGVGDSSILIERSRGRPFQILAVIFQHSPMIFISSDHILSFEDWVNKRVMLDAASNELLLYLEQEGVKLYNLNFMRHTHDVKDLINNNVDIMSASSIHVPYLLAKQSIPYRVFSPRSVGIDFSGDNLFTSDEEVSLRPDRVRAFREASLKGWQYALKYPDIVIQWIMTIYASDYSRALLEFEAQQVFELIQPDIIEIGHLNEARWASVLDIYERLNKLNDPVDLNAVLYRYEAKKNWREIILVTSVSISIFLVLLIIVLYVSKTNRRLDAALKESYEAREEVAKQANQDPLTDLGNRRAFKARLQQMSQVAKRQNEPFALMYLDLDHFKDVNDLYGHQWGDHLLREVSKRLKSCMLEGCELARIGGDEFTILIPSYITKDNLETLAKVILKAISMPYILYEDEVYISASIGITVAPEDSTKPESLLQFADEAMYAAKESGRNRCRFFTSDLYEKAIERQTLIADMRQAMVRNELFVMYQPILDLHSQEVIKFEALVRWQHPIRGLIPPDYFIPIAEESGLISEIGDFVFKESVKKLALWRAQYSPSLMVSVNISPFQITSPDNHISQWFGYLHQVGVPGEAVSLEITENMLMHHTQSVSEQLLAFRDEGINVALDDFGTGYSALAYLNRLDIDYIKIDRSFVQDMAQEGMEKDLCEAIITMAHKLKIKVVAEGIETTEQAAILREFGCDLGQGYLFAKPLTDEQVENLLTQPSFIQY